MKRCSKCGETKRLEEYSRHKRSSDGVRTECKDCAKARDRRYRDANREDLRKRNREHCRKYAKANPEKRREKNRRYREAHPGKSSAYYQANREKMKEYHREYRQTNAHRKKYNNEYYREYVKNNPEKIRTYQHKRRALVCNAEGSHTAEEWLEVVWKQGFACAMCGGIKPLARDHIVPLSKGGSNYISNIQGLCKSCNSRKGAKLPGELTA